MLFIYFTDLTYVFFTTVQSSDSRMKEENHREKWLSSLLDPYESYEFLRRAPLTLTTSSSLFYTKARLPPLSISNHGYRKYVQLDGMMEMFNDIDE